MNYVIREDRGGAAWLRLNRPEAANSLARALVEQLQDHVVRVSTDGAVRAVVVTGVGGSFCAGADLKERQGMSLDETRAYVQLLNDTFDALEALPQPTVAAMQGAALGGGLELALACDFRLAVPRAQLGLPEVRVGILPGAGGTRRLPRVVGAAAVRELVLLGRRISAQRAYEIGLVNEVSENLTAAVEALLTDLGACAPLGVEQAKRVLAGRSTEHEAYEVVLHSEDRVEGLRAFSEKRSANFKGR